MILPGARDYTTAIVVGKTNIHEWAMGSGSSLAA
jgi:hypothetical protein